MGAHPATVKFTKAIDGLDSFGFPVTIKPVISSSTTSGTEPDRVIWSLP
jgi:hypothetical protein